MSNDQLRTAVEQAGLEPEQLANLAQVDIKTVRRWLSGGTPYPRHRNRIARAVGKEPHELWPHIANQPDTAADDATEPESSSSVTTYTDSQDPEAPKLRELLQSATERIDLLDLTLAHLLADSAMVELLADRARHGCHVRILISDPESAHLTITEAEGKPGQTLTARPTLAAEVDSTSELMSPLLETDRVEIRAFVAPAYNSIIRVDDQMLVTLHVWATATQNAPILHLHAGANDGLFDTFDGHYDAIWHQAARPLN